LLAEQRVDQSAARSRRVDRQPGRFHRETSPVS
jgi:hypothetical protein